MWARAALIIIGAAMIGSVGGTLGLQLLTHGSWWPDDVQSIVGLSVFTLIWTVPGALLLTLIFAHLQGAYASLAMGYLGVIPGGAVAGAFMLFLAPTVGCGYGALTAVAWVSLHWLLGRGPPP